MINSITHFEIFSKEPEQLAEFYRTLLGWQIEKASGVDYWRIQTATADDKAIHGGLTFRAIPEPRSWVHYVHVQSVDETIDQVLKLGGELVRKAEDDGCGRKAFPAKDPGG
jgi:predicted enzyme related to lactoylglutathione lyase